MRIEMLFNCIIVVILALMPTAHSTTTTIEECGCEDCTVEAPFNPAATSPPFSNPSKLYHHAGHLYYFRPTNSFSYSYDEAQELCEKWFKGNLASIHNQQEFIFIKNKLMQEIDLEKPEGARIGGKVYENGAEIDWEDGTPSTDFKTAWWYKSGSPNGEPDQMPPLSDDTPASTDWTMVFSLQPPKIYDFGNNYPVDSFVCKMDCTSTSGPCKDVDCGLGHCAAKGFCKCRPNNDNSLCYISDHEDSCPPFECAVSSQDEDCKQDSVNADCKCLERTAECVCPPGYSGVKCEISDNACCLNACRNGGTCSLSNQGEDGYICTCPYPYTGDNCENNEISDECCLEPCLNGGTCIAQPGRGGYKCECPPGYYGLNCELSDTCCINPCQNLGVCTLTPFEKFDYHCECPNGYFGRNCERSDPCLPNPCLYGGSCTTTSYAEDGFYCECTSGYIGRYCQEKYKKPAYQKPAYQKPAYQKRPYYGFDRSTKKPTKKPTSTTYRKSNDNLSLYYGFDDHFDSADDFEDSPSDSGSTFDNQDYFNRNTVSPEKAKRGSTVDRIPTKGKGGRGSIYVRNSDKYGWEA